MTTRRRSSTSGTTDLREVLEVLRSFGVTRYRLGDLEVELAPQQPSRALEDFATTGADAELPEDDDRFDHVGMRPRRGRGEVLS